MREHDINKLIEDSLQSVEGIERAHPKPFLFTRVMASIRERSSAKNVWSKAGAFISKPGVAIAGVACILLLNTGILLLKKNNTEQSATVQNSSLSTDEFVVNAANIYDFENQEP